MECREEMDEDVTGCNRGVKGGMSPFHTPVTIGAGHLASPSLSMRNTKERSAHDRNPQESIRGIGSLSRLGTFCAAAAGFAAGSFFARIRAGRLIPRALWIILILIGVFIRIRIRIFIRN